MSLVKICGITEEQEVEYVNEAGADFMGMVMFFPKSKRNITVEKASSLIKIRSGNGRTDARSDTGDRSGRNPDDPDSWGCQRRTAAGDPYSCYQSI